MHMHVWHLQGHWAMAISSKWSLWGKCVYHLLSAVTHRIASLLHKNNMLIYAGDYSGENPQYSMEITSREKSMVWVLLSRHITELQDFANNKEFITCHVFKGVRSVAVSSLSELCPCTVQSDGIFKEVHIGSVTMWCDRFVNHCTYMSCVIPLGVVCWVQVYCPSLTMSNIIPCCVLHVCAMAPCWTHKYTSTRRCVRCVVFVRLY